MYKRDKELNSWDGPLLEAQQAMGLFETGPTPWEKEMALIKTGEYDLSSVGPQRLIRKHNYAKLHGE